MGGHETLAEATSNNLALPSAELRRHPPMPLVVFAVVWSILVSFLTARFYYAVWTLFIPIVASALPLVVRHGRGARVLRIASIVVLAGWVLVGGFSVGMFYVPALLAMIEATRRVRE